MAARTDAIPHPRHTPRSADGPLRLRLGTTRAGYAVLNGAWWPYTDDLAAELPALVTALDSWLDGSRREYGEHLSRIAANPAGWPVRPTRLRAAGRVLRVSWFDSIDPHTISASCPTTDRFDLLVIPPEVDAHTAEQATLTAIDARNELRASEILAAVAPLSVSDPVWRRVDERQRQQWETDGGRTLRAPDPARTVAAARPVETVRPGELPTGTGMESWRLLDDGDPEEGDEDSRQAHRAFPPAPRRSPDERPR